MDNFDVRIREGRFVRLVVAMVIGVTATNVTALILPQQGLGRGAGPSTFLLPALIVLGAGVVTIMFTTGHQAPSRCFPLDAPSELPRARLRSR